MSARAVTVWFLDTDDPAALLHNLLAEGDSTGGVGPDGVGPDGIDTDGVNDVTAAQRIGSAIYGDSVLLPAIDTTLDAAMAADDSRVYCGHYGRLSVVSCSLFETNRPSTLTRTIGTIQRSAAATLLVTDPDTSTGVFARWEDGELRRAFSADPVRIIENIGVPYPFEAPFWAGEHPLHYTPGVPPDPQALPFHPQQLAEEANRTWLGFRFTRPLIDGDIDPNTIPVTGYSIHPADYQPSSADLDRYRQASTPQPEAAPVPEKPVSAATKVARYFGFGGNRS